MTSFQLTRSRTTGRAGDDGWWAQRQEVWGRWKPAWHLFFYTSLAIATAVALADQPRSVGSVTLIAALAGGLAVWYWLFLVGDHRQIPAGPGLTYFVGAAVLWGVLFTLHPVFLVLAWSAFAPFCLLNHRWGISVILLALAGWALQAIVAGQVSWVDGAVLALVVFGGAVITGYVSAMARRSRERQRLIDELETTRADLAAAERQAGMLEERQRLARDIHDTLAQGFTSIVMLLEAAQESLSGQPATDHIERALRTARANLSEARRLVWALRPESLTERSLPEALRQLTSEFAEDTGVRATTVITGAVRALAPEVETALLRVAQEALANARKHARPHELTVTLSYMSDLAALDVRDDGVGFDPALLGATQPAASGLGLRAMRERIEELGGTLALESSPGEGTTLAAELPTAEQPHLEPPTESAAPWPDRSAS